MLTKYVVLGCSGFLGKHLFNAFKNFASNNLIALNRSNFDITDESTYDHFKPGAKYIFYDTINVNNGDVNLIQKVNVDGLSLFLNWLNDRNIEYHYVYYSTLSTLYDDVVSQNSYVQSKKNAESIIKIFCKKFTIIRLTFPFGENENPNRMLPRIITELKKGNSVTIDNLLINLTPVEEVIKFSLREALNNSEVNFTDGNIYKLQEIVAYLAKGLGLRSDLVIYGKNEMDLSIKTSAFKSGYSFDIYSMLKKTYFV